MVKAFVVAALLFSAVPVLAADVNSFCAFRTPEQYVCDISEGSKIINGKRIYCARNLECVGMDDSKGFRVRGTCQLRRETYKGACLATHFAGQDGKWYPLSMRDAIPMGPGFKEFQRAPLMDIPSGFASNPSSLGSSGILDAFDQYDDAPQPLTPLRDTAPGGYDVPVAKVAPSPFSIPQGDFTPFIPGEPGITSIAKSPPPSPALIAPASESTGFKSASSVSQQPWYQTLWGYATDSWSTVSDFFTRQHICYGQPGDRCQ